MKIRYPRVYKQYGLLFIIIGSSFVVGSIINFFTGGSILSFPMYLVIGIILIIIGILELITYRIYIKEIKSHKLASSISKPDVTSTNKTELIAIIEEVYANRIIKIEHTNGKYAVIIYSLFYIGPLINCIVQDSLTLDKFISSTLMLLALFILFVFKIEMNKNQVRKKKTRS